MTEVSEEQEWPEEYETPVIEPLGSVWTHTGAGGIGLIDSSEPADGSL